MVAIDVRLGEMPERLLAEQAAGSILYQLGITFGIGSGGPVVTRAWRGFPAAGFGFERGQRVVSVGGMTVDDPTEIIIGFNRAGLLTGETVPVVVVDDGERKTLRVRLEF